MNGADEQKGIRYFVFRESPSVESETADEDGYMEIEDWNATEGFEDWGRGRVAQQRPAGPVEIAAVPYGGYQGGPDEYMDSNVPLMSKRLKEAIEAAGADNLNFYPITLRNAETGETYEYFAFNLIGLIDVVDLGQSTMTSHDGDFIGDTAISDLAVEEEAARGLLMFRLKQKFSVILAHKKIKEAVEAVGIPSVKFIEPGDFMAL
jgi:hypothetical protein